MNSYFVRILFLLVAIFNFSIPSFASGTIACSELFDGSSDHFGGPKTFNELRSQSGLRLSRNSTDVTALYPGLLKLVGKKLVLKSSKQRKSVNPEIKFYLDESGKLKVTYQNGKVGPYYGQIKVYAVNSWMGNFIKVEITIESDRTGNTPLIHEGVDLPGGGFWETGTWASVARIAINLTNFSNGFNKNQAINATLYHTIDGQIFGEKFNDSTIDSVLPSERP